MRALPNAPVGWACARPAWRRSGAARAGGMRARSAWGPGCERGRRAGAAAVRRGGGGGGGRGAAARRCLTGVVAVGGRFGAGGGLGGVGRGDGEREGVGP